MEDHKGFYGKSPIMLAIDDVTHLKNKAIIHRMEQTFRMRLARFLTPFERGRLKDKLLDTASYARNAYTGEGKPEVIALQREF